MRGNNMANFDDPYKQLSLNAFQEAVKAADPFVAVQNKIASEEFKSSLGQFKGTEIVPVAVGKAAVAMMAALYQAFASDIFAKFNIHPGLLVTHVGNKENFSTHAASMPDVRVHFAGHPVPDMAGQRAAQDILELAQALDEKYSLLICVSGGASAMLPAPLNGVSLTDKQTVTELLLGCGATIQEMNIVRKHLSAIKGGRLVQQAAPATVTGFILSDVVGDDLSAIASGPTVALLRLFTVIFQVGFSHTLL